jgi:20S proteasome alpha/beta subunit
VHDTIWCCRSGSAADTQAVADIVSYHLNMYGVTNAEAPTTQVAASLFQELFVGDSVGNVGTGGCSTVRTQDDSVFEVDSHAVGTLVAMVADGKVRELQLNLHRGAELSSSADSNQLTSPDGIHVDMNHLKSGEVK